jgi:hypothetical protein
VLAAQTATQPARNLCGALEPLPEPGVVRNGTTLTHRVCCSELSRPGGGRRVESSGEEAPDDAEGYAVESVPECEGEQRVAPGLCSRKVFVAQEGTGASIAEPAGDMIHRIWGRTGEVINAAACSTPRNSGRGRLQRANQPRCHHMELPRGASVRCCNEGGWPRERLASFGAPPAAGRTCRQSKNCSARRP